MAAQEDGGRSYAEVCADTLDIDKYRRLVEDDGAGAISSFVGVTRNVFQNKV